MEIKRTMKLIHKLYLDVCNINIQSLIMNLLLYSFLLSGCDSFLLSSFRSIQNKPVGFIPKKMTSDAGCPTGSLKDTGHFKYYDPSTVTPSYYDIDSNSITPQEYRSNNTAMFSNHYSDLSGDESSKFLRDAHSRIAIHKSRRSTLTNNREKIIVDFGCGVGISTQHLRELFPKDIIFGLDISPHLLNGTDGINAIFEHRDISHTKLPDSFADIVSISYVLHGMPYMESLRVLREAFRILKTGGILNVLDMNHSVDPSTIMESMSDHKEPCPTEYKELLINKDSDLKSIGFVKIESCVSYSKTIMFSARK